MAKYKVVFDPDGQVHIIADPESTSEAVVTKTAGLVDFDVHFTSGKTYTITAPEGTPDSTIQQAAWDKHNKYLAEVAASKNTTTTQTTLATPQPLVDTKPAYKGGALGGAVALFLCGALIFKVITWGLDRKTLDTPTKYGRWVWGIVAALVIASSGNLMRLPLEEYSYRLWLLLIPLSIVGFVAGYLWKLFTREQPYTHVKCPDCRELVLRDARKCKHCGCGLIPQ